MNSPPGIYPSASSASELDDDEEKAYNDRACSILLHAMWQIDYRIREPPSYEYELMKNNVAAAEERPQRFPPLPKDRLPFQCTASLKLYFSKRLVDECKDTATIMDFWESPLEHSQAKPSALSPQRKGDGTNNEQSRKRKDSFASQATPSPARQLLRRGKHGEVPSPTDAQEQGETVPHRIESTGTGSTKRESKHRASAKLLAMLFPECSSMVEVMAAAEAARECYAAKREEAIAQTKRAKLSNSRSFSPAATAALLPTTNAEGFSHNDQLSQLRLTMKHSSDKLKVAKTEEAEALNDDLFSVAGLSLSEPTRDSKNTLEKKVKIALKLMYGGKETEGSAGFRLRCMGIDDYDRLGSLLNESLETQNTSTDREETVQKDARVTSEFNLSDLKLSSSTAVLLITRTDVSNDDSPLGMSILSTLGNESKENMLSVNFLKHEDHLPRETFIECLEELANTLSFTLDMSNIMEDCPIKSFVSDYLDIQGAKGKDPGIPTANVHLQSVEEEDEEAEGSGEEANENDHTGRKRSRVD